MFCTKYMYPKSNSQNPHIDYTVTRSYWSSETTTLTRLRPVFGGGRMPREFWAWSELWLLTCSPPSMLRLMISLFWSNRTLLLLPLDSSQWPLPSSGHSWCGDRRIGSSESSRRLRMSCEDDLDLDSNDLPDESLDLPLELSLIVADRASITWRVLTVGVVSWSCVWYRLPDGLPLYFFPLLKLLLSDPGCLLLLLPRWWVSSGSGWMFWRSGSGLNPTGHKLSSIFLNVIDILQSETRIWVPYINEKGHRAGVLSFYSWLKFENLYLLVGTAGTQCFATSAPLPFKTSTDLNRNGIQEFSYNTSNNWPTSSYELCSSANQHS